MRRLPGCRWGVELRPFGCPLRDALIAYVAGEAFGASRAGHSRGSDPVSRPAREHVWYVRIALSTCPESVVTVNLRR